MSFRNERKLYKRNCDATGDQIISIYSPDKPYKVYDQKFRRSDQWDPMDYGRGFDFSKNFTENFRELMKEVPRWGMIITSDVENSPYTNYTASSRDIYMCSDVYESQYIMYSHTIKNLTLCMDSLELKQSDHSYWCTFSTNLHKCYYTDFCSFCTDSFYLSYCANLNNSMYCVGISNKSFCILNKQYSQDEYKNAIKNINHHLIYSEYKRLISNYIYGSRILNSEKVI